MDGAGLALGAVSLGIEVVKSIIEYANAVRDMTDDLQSLERHATTLGSNLHILKSALLQSSTPLEGSSSILQIPTGTIKIIESSVQSCEADLIVLRDFLIKNACGSLLTAPDFASRCREGFKRLKYGFKGKKRAEMEARLTTVNTILLVGIEAWQMHTGYTQTIQLETLHSESLDIKTSVNDQTQRLASIETETVAVSNQLSSVVATVNDTLLPASQQTTAALATFGDQLDDKMGTMMSTCAALSADVQTLRNLAEHKAIPPVALSYVNRMESLAMIRASHIVSSVDHLAPRPALQTRWSDIDGRPVPELPSWSTCDCKSYQKTRTWKAQLGTTQLSTKEVERFEHLPYCRFSRGFGVQKDRSRIIAARIQIFHTMVEAAFKMSWNFCQGSGSFRISPGLLYFNVVNGHTAPAFQLLNTMANAIQIDGGLTTQPCPTDRDLAAQHILSHGLQKLRLIFTENRASPTDVTNYGETLFHMFDYVACTIFCNPALLEQYHCRQGLLLLCSELAATFRVPVELENNHGYSFLDRMFHVLRHCHLAEILSVFPPKFKGSMRCPKVTRWYPGMRAALTCDISITGMLDIDPLSNAILQNQGQLVSRVIYKEPSIVWEKAAFGRANYLILAIEMGRCVDEILTALTTPASRETNCTTVLHKLLTDPDSDEESLAELALRSCETVEGHDCPWTLILVLLFQEQCVLRTGAKMRLGSTIPCDSCCRTYATEMALRQRQLQRLAVATLLPCQIDQLALDQDTILDEHTNTVISMLRAMSEEVPNYLINGNKDFGYVSVFNNNTLAANLADHFMAAGFQKLDSIGPQGLTPIESSLTHSEPGDLAFWFLKQGVEFGRKLSPEVKRRLLDNEPYWLPPEVVQVINQGTTASHLFCGGYAATLRNHYYDALHNLRPANRFSWHDTNLLSSTLGDENQCLCVGDGFQPYTYLMLGFFDLQEHGDSRSPVVFAHRTRTLFVRCQGLLGADQYKATFRFMTFEILSLVHTCGLGDFGSDLSGDSFPCHDDQDTDALRAFEKIYEELSHLIEEDYAVELGQCSEEWKSENDAESSEMEEGDSAATDRGSKHKEEVENADDETTNEETQSFDDGSKQDALFVRVSTKSGSSPGPNCSKGRLPDTEELEESEVEVLGVEKLEAITYPPNVPTEEELWDLWINVWVARVEAALDMLYERDVAAGKRIAAEELGVSWAEDEESTSSENEYGTLEYWLRRIDKI